MQGKQQQCVDGVEERFSGGSELLYQLMKQQFFVCVQFPLYHVAKRMSG